MLLIRREIILELRNKVTLPGLLLYLFSTVFVAYTGFSGVPGLLPVPAWNALLWVVLLFVAINAIAKSFMGHNQGLKYYEYQLAHPAKLITAKIIYNILLMSVLSIAGLLLFGLFLSNPVQNTGLFLVALVLGASGFSGTLTLVSSIANEAKGGAVLMAVLSFPVLIPLVKLLVKVSKIAADGVNSSTVWQYVGLLLALNVLVFILSIILFPFLWRS